MKVLLIMSAISLLIWCVGFGIGYQQFSVPDSTEIAARSKQLDYTSSSDAFFKIAANNLKVAGLNILGIGTLGLSTLYILFVNGMTIGFDLHAFTIAVPLHEILAVTLPHSFELVGIWLSAGCAFTFLWCGYHFVVNNKLDLRLIKLSAVSALASALIILLAAGVEAYYSLSGLL